MAQSHGAIFPGEVVTSRCRLPSQVRGWEMEGEDTASVHPWALQGAQDPGPAVLPVLSQARLGQGLPALVRVCVVCTKGP